MKDFKRIKPFSFDEDNGKLQQNVIIIYNKDKEEENTKGVKMKGQNTAGFMGKVSSKESMTFKQRRQSKNTRNKYLRPGALAQLRYSRATIRSCSDIGATIRSCSDIGKKRVRVFDNDNLKKDLLLTTKVAKHSPSMLSPEIDRFRSMVESMDVEHKNLPRTPRTPLTANWDSYSSLESLPMDILVKILCHLHHDQLKAVILISKTITTAVLLARERHFNYTTPDRSRQEMFVAKPTLCTEHGSLLNKGDGKRMWVSAPHTPKAPKQGRRLASRMNFEEMRQITAALFQESTFPSRCGMPPGLPRHPCKAQAPTRVLVYEDELCQAVVNNKLH